MKSGGGGRVEVDARVGGVRVVHGRVVPHGLILGVGVCGGLVHVPRLGLGCGVVEARLLWVDFVVGSALALPRSVLDGAVDVDGDPEEEADFGGTPEDLLPAYGLACRLEAFAL